MPLSYHSLVGFSFSFSDFIVTKPSDDSWKMETVSTFKTTVVEFKEGVEFEEKTADDRLVKSTITFEGNSLEIFE